MVGEIQGRRLPEMFNIGGDSQNIHGPSFCDALRRCPSCQVPGETVARHNEKKSCVMQLVPCIETRS